MCDLRLTFILPLELSTWHNSGQDLASSLRAKSPLLYASIGAGQVLLAPTRRGKQKLWRHTAIHQTVARNEMDA